MMNWWTAKRGVQGLAAALIFVAGIGTGWMLWRPKAPKVETYAPEKRQADGSLVLERKPQPDARPAHEIPKGAKMERIVQVQVKPRNDTPTAATGTPGSGPVNVLPELPPVTVDLSLVRLPDQTRRVIVSSPNGEVIGGVDVPVEAAPPVRSLKWAGGGLWNPSDRTWGAWVQRDLGPAVVGVDAFQVRDPPFAGGRIRWAGMLRGGIRF